MPRTGNGSTGTIDIGAFVANFAATQKRAKELAKQQQDIAKRRSQLDREQANLEREIAALGIGGTATPTRQPRQTKARANGNGARKGKPGRKPGSKTATKRAAKASTGNGEPKLTTLSALLQVVPDGDPMSKQDITNAVNKLGLKRSSVVVGQTLGGSKFFLNPSRGMWKLSASGVKARDKASDASTSDNSGASDSTDSGASAAQPAAPAPAAPASAAPAPAQPA